MFLPAELLLSQLLVVLAAFYLLVLVAALKTAPWRKLLADNNSNIYFGALVGLLLLWMLATRFEVGTYFHLTALTSLTLMVGWQLALIGGSVVLIAQIAIWQHAWLDFIPTAMVGVLMPAIVTWFMLLLVRSILPKHFFIYIFFNAFLTGALAIITAASFTAALLFWSGMPFETLWNSFIIWFPMMLFPEAVLNGWIMTVFVGLKPQWVMTFRDDEYLKGK